MRKFVLLFSMILLGSSTLFAQNQRVSGTVTGPDGAPVIGATVLVEGTQTAAFTDPSGQYSISVPANANLVYSYFGLESQTLAVGGRTVINVVMAVNENLIDRVVVTALGMANSEKALSYSANQVDAEEIERGGSRSLLSAVQGKFAGVNIATSSGAPGASNRIVLRGYRSVTGSNEPLWIVDGVPVSNDAINDDSLNGSVDYGNRGNDINPDDIASMSILKGSAASALYGSRAANGVILITTKSGQMGADQDVRVEYTNDTKFTRVAYLPQMQNRFGQGWQSHDWLRENGSWGPKFTGEYRLWGSVVDGEQQYKKYVALPDNVKDFYETGLVETNSINVSGGTEKTSFFMSYSNSYNDGVLPGNFDNLVRNNAAFRGSAKGKVLSASASVSYTNKKVNQAQGGQGYSVFNNAMQIPRDHSLVDGKDYKSKFYNIDNYFTGYGVVNPYYSLAEDGNFFNEDHIFGSIQISGQINPWLSATVRAGNDHSAYQTDEWRSIFHAGGANTGSTDQDGSFKSETGYSNEFNGDAFLQFNPTFGEDFTLSGMLGYNINERQKSSLEAEVIGLDVPYFYDLSNSPSTPTVNNYWEKRRMMGVYFNADLDWRSTLFLNVAMRNDWSSTLPAGKRGFFSPSVGVSASLTDAFPVLRKFMTFAKVRASYGETGNDAPIYGLKSVYARAQFSNPFGNVLMPLNGVNGYEFSNQIGSPTLRPERTKEFEVGFDFRFFNNRLGIDFAYYDGRSVDQILPVPMAGSTGFTRQLMNIGEIRNKGIEIALSGTPIRSGDFQWDVNLTFARNRNTVIKLAEGLEEVSINGFSGGTGVFAIEGYPMGIYKMLVPLQVQVGSNGQEVTSGGDIKTVVDATGIPILTSSQVNTNKGIQADFTMGFSTTFSWKSLALSVSIDGRKGGWLYSRTADINYFVGNAPQTIYNDRQPFVVPNSVQRLVDPLNIHPTVYYENNTPVDMTHTDAFYNNGGFQGEESMLVSRTNVRLREVVLSYVFPSTWFERGPVRGLSFSLIGNNLFLWRPKSNRFVDPEASTYGNGLSGEFGEFSGHPSVRTFGFNLKATF